MCKATVLGAAGRVGQPLSLLLKCSPLIDELALYDIANSMGVAADLSHLNTSVTVSGYLPVNNGLRIALKDADVVFVLAGIHQKPGMSREDLFDDNAIIILDLAKEIAKTCPDAFIFVVSNPVNSLVPIIAEVMKAANVFNPKKLLGVTTLDIIRASTFSAEIVSELSPNDIIIPVLGGHSNKTIVPIFSQAKPPIKLEENTLHSLTTRIRLAGDEIIHAKQDLGSATLCMAYAAFIFMEAVLKAAKGAKGIVQPSYVYLPGIPGGEIVQKSIDGIDYFSADIEFGMDGAMKVCPLGELSAFEEHLLKEAIVELRSNIEKGVGFFIETEKLSET